MHLINAESVLYQGQLQAWLQTDDSLTDKAKALCQDVNVQLIGKDWLRPVADSGERQREIIMVCDGEPWWYAKTLVPQETFNKREQAFNQLGSNSLGNMLFFDKGIIKRFAYYYQLTPLMHEYRPLKILSLVDEKSSPIFARRSIFEIDRSPLFLLEVFLPFMVDKLCHLAN